MASKQLNVSQDMVQYGTDLAPIVQLIEKTPRDKCAPAITEQIQRGLTYRQFLTALLLSAMRKSNANHEVYWIHAAHQMSLDMQYNNQLLPLFWAMDSFKREQENSPAPILAPLKGPLPAPQQAQKEFQEGMEAWDQERAERGLVSLVRNVGPSAIIEDLWHYGARDWGFIGHKIIAVANCWRTLHAVGWQYAEPMLRFVISQLMNNRGDDQSDVLYNANLARLQQAAPAMPPDWTRLDGDTEATLELLAEMRDGNVGGVCDLGLGMLHRRVPAGAVWDAVHLAAGEFMLRHRHGGYKEGSGLNTRPLHSNTVTNAFHYAFLHNGNPQTQLFLLLQAVGWIAEFIRVEKSRDNLRDLQITELKGDVVTTPPQLIVEEIFSLLPSRQMRQEIADRSSQDRASQKAFFLAERYPDSQVFLQTAREFVGKKATADSHDYKFPVALFEDYALINPQWRPHLLAVSVHWLHGPQSSDSPVFQQVKELLL